MICMQQRMAWWIMDSGYATSLAGKAIIFCILMTMSMKVQARDGHVGIVNDFLSPTQFRCHSNKMTRQRYTTSPGEVYYFAFDKTLHEYWDCNVRNRATSRSGTFRCYGDDSHGGRELWSCSDCVFSVQEVGVFFYQNGQWMYRRSWHMATSHRLN